MKERMSESSANQGPVGGSMNETSVGAPTRQGQAPLEQLPSPSHRRRYLTLGGAAAISTAAIVAVASRFGGAPRPQNPDTTPLPVGVVEPSPTGGMPSADATMNVGGQTFEATVPPTPSLEPTLPPTPEPTPTPTPTETPTLQPTPTPTEIVQSKDFATIVESVAKFDAGGELDDSNGEYQLKYSRGLLDFAGIESISTDSKTMENIHKKIIEMIYEGVHQKVGSDLRILYANRTEPSIVMDKLRQWVTQSSEIIDIKNALQANGVEFVDTYNGGIMYKDPQDTLYFVRAANGSGGLDTVPQGWDQQDAALRVCYSGPASILWDVRNNVMTEKYHSDFTEEGLTDIYPPCGLNEGNNYGRTGEKGSFDFKFK